MTVVFVLLVAPTVAVGPVLAKSADKADVEVLGTVTGSLDGKTYEWETITSKVKGHEMSSAHWKFVDLKSNAPAMTDFAQQQPVI